MTTPRCWPKAFNVRGIVAFMSCRAASVGLATIVLLAACPETPALAVPNADSHRDLPHLQPNSPAAGIKRAANEGTFEEGLAAYKAGDVDRARQIWLTLAEQGNPVAQNNLGSIAEKRGSPQDLLVAANWYAKAAAGGYAIAQHNLAVLYEKGLGVPQDYALARRWYGVAAAQGDAEALTNLGLMQYRGEGGPRDPSAAVETFIKAAKLGSAKAEFNLGNLFERGDGVPANAGTAAMWYQQAADSDYAPAMSNLGLLYAKGVGVPQDFAKANDAFRRAAEQGDASGQYLLAIGYRHGTGVTQDPVAALEWFTLAAAQGHRDAAKQRDELAASMNQTDVDTAIQRARDWRSSSARRNNHQ